MELFLTDSASLRRRLEVDGKPLELGEQTYSIPTSAVQSMIREAVPDGMPFVLDDHGRYDFTINRFFRDLPVMGCRSVHTWQAYARDIVTFNRFLQERCGGKRLLDASMDDLSLYYRTRRLTGVQAVNPTTWNRSIAALDKFFQWAFERKIISTLPFTYASVTRHINGFEAPQSLKRNNALERASGGDTIKCVSFDDYVTFRNVGLLGQLPDGTLDPKFRGRNRLRNVAFAELLVTTGVRLEEGGTMLKVELPDIDDGKWKGYRSCKMRLARLTTKGDKGRTIWLPKRVLTEFLAPYILEDRENAVIGAVKAGVYADLDNSLIATSWRQGVLSIRQHDGSVVKSQFDGISPLDRRRLFMTANAGQMEPAMLWLTESGQPTTLNNFEAVFQRACERCSSFGIQVSITPHVLRHTFAVYMLTNLIKGVVSEGATSKAANGDGVYRRVVADPLRTLQRLMGHSSITTTYKYLTYLEEAEELIDTAIGSWGDMLGTPADHVDVGVQE